MLDPKSPLSLSISDLYLGTLAIAAVILLLVTGLVLYSIVKFRARPGDEEPPANFGHLRLEIAWTAGPFLILVVLAVFTVNTMGTSDPDPGKGSTPDIIVVGHQWWWEIRYPQAGSTTVFTTANEIHMAAGKKTLFQLESADVIHDLWIPDLGRKMDMTPNYHHQLYLQSNEPGTYLGACAEYCGAEHAWMLIKAIVQPPAEFDAWQQAQLQRQSVPTSGTAARGWQVFSQKTCINCHAINGTGANSYVGPDLTHLASRTTLGAGVLTNTRDNLQKWIADPHAVKPSVYMPKVQMTAEELQSLVDYLETLK